MIQVVVTATKKCCVLRNRKSLFFNIQPHSLNFLPGSLNVTIQLWFSYCVNFPIVSLNV